VIFRRAILREFANLAVVAFVALIAIWATTLLIRILDQAASGKLASEAVLVVLALQLLFYLPVLLSITLFFAVLMTLSRGYRDSEMIVWFSSGLPLTAWIRPVAVFAAPLVLVIAVLSFVLTPWAAQQAEQFKNKLEHQDEISRVSPGVFRESARSDRIVFVEGVDGNSREVQNIFVNSLIDNRLSITMSKRGYQETHPNGDRFLVLMNGRRYDGTPGTPEYKVWDFEKYSLRIDSPEPPDLQASISALSTLALLETPDNGHKAELMWRIGLPLAAFNLALLAIPLSFVNPRAGRSANLLLACLIYMVYSSMMRIASSWVTQGRLQFEIGWWVVHVAMLLVLFALFYRRLAVLPMFAWLRYRSLSRNGAESAN
jgi:lipopolysaccharide export system permease protein